MEIHQSVSNQLQALEDDILVISGLCVHIFVCTFKEAYFLKCHWNFKLVLNPLIVIKTPFWSTGVIHRLCNVNFILYWFFAVSKYTKNREINQL